MEDLIWINRVPELQKFGTKSAISRWLKSGKLEGRKVAGRWYTTKEAVTRFIAGEKPAGGSNGR